MDTTFVTIFMCLIMNIGKKMVNWYDNDKKTFTYCHFRAMTKVVLLEKTLFTSKKKNIFVTQLVLLTISNIDLI